MIEINLLPHREARRAADLRQSLALLVLGGVLLGGGIFWIERSMEKDLSNIQTSVRQLEADIARYQPQQKQVAAFKKTRAELEGKLDVIHGLDRARSGPVRLMDELANRTPERLWLTSLRTQGSQLKLEGESLDTGLVADFLRSLNASKYFVNVDLDKTNRGKEVQGVKLVHFVISAELTTPVEGPAANASGGA